MAAAQEPGYRPLSPRWCNALPARSANDRIANYLAHMTPGGMITSNFMAMCEVASSEQVRSVKCGRCKGLGFRVGDAMKIAQWQHQIAKPNVTPERRDNLREKLRRESECRQCEGTGFRERSATREQAHQIFTTVRCGKCLGSGEIVNEDTEDECPRCSGDGCVVPQTVRATGSSKKGKLPPGATSMTEEVAWSPPVPDENAEEQNLEFSKTADVLRAVHQGDEVAARAARAYHGPEGDKWELHAWGRRFVLWQFTDGGQGLAELFLHRGELKGAGYLVWPMDRIVAERETESRATTPDMLCRSLISRADREARQLEARMQEAIWVAEASFG